MSLLTIAAFVWLADTETPAAVAPQASSAEVVTETKTETRVVADSADDDDDDAEIDDEGERRVVVKKHKRRHHDHHFHRHERERQWDNVVRGIALTLLGGGDVRAREDMARLGRQLGPAGDPSRFGAMWSIQGVLQLTRYARIGADFTMTGMSSIGRGLDRGNIEVRQAVDYRYWAGGLLAEAVLPVSRRVELSLGTVLGGGRLSVEGRTTRLSDYSQLGADLRAIPKSETFSLEAPAFFMKPAIGVKVKFTAHVALDLRAGVNVFYVFKNTLSVFNAFPLNGSPEQTELMPFAAVGVSFGAWAQ